MIKVIYYSNNAKIDYEMASESKLIILIVCSVVLFSGCIERPKDPEIKPNKTAQDNVTKITLEDAKALASGVAQVKSFVLMHPAHHSDAVNAKGCKLIGKMFGKQLNCKDSGEYAIIGYWVGIDWEDLSSSAVKVAIDIQTSDVVGVYPDVEYLSDRYYCKENSDCVAASSGCACVNFIHRYPPDDIIEEACGPGVAVSDCVCLENRCQ